MTLPAASGRPQMPIIWGLFSHFKSQFLDKHQTDFENVDSFGKRDSSAYRILLLSLEGEIQMGLPYLKLRCVSHSPSNWRALLLPITEFLLYTRYRMHAHLFNCHDNEEPDARDEFGQRKFDRRHLPTRIGQDLFDIVANFGQQVHQGGGKEHAARDAIQQVQDAVCGRAGTLEQGPRADVNQVVLGAAADLGKGRVRDG